MTNKDIIEMYEKGISIKSISKKYQSYTNKNYELFYHSLNSLYNPYKTITYDQSVIYVQDLIIKYLSGYFE